MKETAYSVASPQPPASRAKRELLAIDGLEEVRIKDERQREAWRMRRARQHEQSGPRPSDITGGSEPDFQLGGGGVASGERNWRVGRKEDGRPGPGSGGFLTERTMEYLEQPSGAPHYSSNSYLA